MTEKTKKFKEYATLDIEKLNKLENLAHRTFWEYEGEPEDGSSHDFYINVHLLNDPENFDCTSSKTMALFLIQIKRKHDDTNCGQELFLVNKTREGKAIGYLIGTLNHYPAKDNCKNYVTINY